MPVRLGRLRSGNHLARFDEPPGANDREQIDDVMHAVAAAVERNDLNGVLEHVYAASGAGIQHAKSEFPTYKFTSARITRVKSIEVDPHMNPPSAISEIFVSVSVSGRGVEVRNYPRFVRVYLLREGERWRVSDYEHFSVSDGFRGLPGDP